MALRLNLLLINALLVNLLLIIFVPFQVSLLLLTLRALRPHDDPLSRTFQVNLNVQ